MPEIKLGRLPDRTPVKITISVRPELNRLLGEYQSIYEKTYGQAESISELIPYMLESFLESDRSFTKTLKEKDA